VRPYLIAILIASGTWSVVKIDALNVVLLSNAFISLLSMVYFIRTLFLKASKSIWLVMGIT